MKRGMPSLVRIGDYFLKLVFRDRRHFNSISCVSNLKGQDIVLVSCLTHLLVTDKFNLKREVSTVTDSRINGLLQSFLLKSYRSEFAKAIFVLLCRQKYQKLPTR